MGPLKALDLFCGAGGAAMGLHRAGYMVVGVDSKTQPHYPFHFILGDAMAWLDRDLSEFDLIWASPPCQAYSVLTPKERKADHPDLLPKVLDKLRYQRIPYIVENVPQTQRMMRSPIFLCGTMFGLNIWRHRWFEIGNVHNHFFLLPPCNHGNCPVLISGRGMKRDGSGRRAAEPSVATRRNAIGIDWMSGAELDNAIPPCYSEFLGRQVAQAVQRREGITAEYAYL